LGQLFGWVGFGPGWLCARLTFAGLPLGRIGFGLVWLCAKLAFCQVSYMGWVGFGLAQLEL